MTVSMPGSTRVRSTSRVSVTRPRPAACPRGVRRRRCGRAGCRRRSRRRSGPCRGQQQRRGIGVGHAGTGTPAHVDPQCRGRHRCVRSLRHGHVRPHHRSPRRASPGIRRCASAQPNPPRVGRPRPWGEPPPATAGNAPGTRPLHEFRLAVRPFSMNSLALGIASHPGRGKQPSYRSPQPAHRGLNLCAMTSPAPCMAADTPPLPSRTPRSTTRSWPSGAPRRSPRSGSPPRTRRKPVICPHFPRRCRPPGGTVPAVLRLPQPAMPQPAPLQQAHTAYIPQQATAPRGYPGPQQQPPRQPQPAGYEAMRPAAARGRRPRRTRTRTTTSSTGGTERRPERAERIRGRRPVMARWPHGERSCALDPRSSGQGLPEPAAPGGRRGALGSGR